MSYSFSKSLTVPAAAMVFGLVANTLAACSDDPAADASIADASVADSSVADALPVVRNISLETAEDMPLDVHLPASGDGALTFTIVDAPDHGTLGEVSATGAITYTPSADYNGEDAFVFRATNREGQSAEGTVTITVTPVNDEPTVSSVANQKITADTSTGDLAFTVADAETAAANLTVTASSSNTDLVPNDPSNLVLGGSGSSRTLAVVPAARASGSTTITLSVSDGSATTTMTFTLEVAGVASLYWMTASGSLWRVDVNGKNAVELVTAISGASSVATDSVGRNVFYSRGSAIVRADSDGANRVDVVANAGYPSGLAIDSTNRKMYWSDFNGKQVMRAELDGSNPTQVVGNIDSPSAIAFDATHGKAYVITYNNTKLVRFNFDGTNQETIASNLGGLGVGLAVDSTAGKLYYATRGPNLYVANLDGSNATTLVTNQSTVYGIAIDDMAGRLYWADWLGTVIRSANLADGSDSQDVNSGSARNLGLAWMPAP